MAPTKEPPTKADAPKPKTRHKPLPGESWLFDFWEGLKGWRNLILIVVLGGIFFAGSRIDAARPLLAEAIAVIFPVVTIAYVIWEVRAFSHKLIRNVTIVVAVAALLGAETMLFQTFHPPAALDTTTLTPAHPDASFRIADGEQELVVQARGKLSTTGAGQGSFAVIFKRGEDEQTFSGEFSRVIGQGRAMMRRMAPTTTVTTTEVVRETLKFPGRGPLRAHLDSVDGSVHKAVRLSLISEPPLHAPLRYVLIGASILALLLEVLAARQRLRAALFAGVSAAAFMGIYIPHQFDPDDPLSIVAGGAIAAMAACVLGGFVLGRLAVFLFAGSAEEEPASKAKR